MKKLKTISDIIKAKSELPKGCVLRVDNDCAYFEDIDGETIVFLDQGPEELLIEALRAIGITAEGV